MQNLMGGMVTEQDAEGRDVVIYYGQAKRGDAGREDRIGVMRIRRLLPCPDAPIGRTIGQEWVEGVEFPNTNRGWDDCAAYVYRVNGGTEPAPTGPTAPVQIVRTFA